jgi:hypothetical protein
MNGIIRMLLYKKEKTSYMKKQWRPPSRKKTMSSASIIIFVLCAVIL